jgi:predicted XRE-type DNA-binding protein/predicted transcriptional regulator
MKASDQSDLYKKILLEIRRAIDENGISQKAIGEALSIKQSAVSSLLNGHSNLNIAQLLGVCDVLGLAPHVVMFRALHSSVNPKKQPDWVSGILYKSWIHLLIYVATTQPVSLKDLLTTQIDRAAAEKAIEDLVGVGLIKKSGDKYKQLQSESVMAGDPYMQTLCHKEIINRGMEAWGDARKRSLKEFFKTRFNMFHVDRFTDSQILEIESHLWKAFDKMKEFQMANTSKGYEGRAQMRVWNIHLMLSTPFELGET